MQAGTYSARRDRRLIEHLFAAKERVISGFVVGQRAAGANLSVDITAGVAVVMGDDQTFQGMYLVESTTTGTDNFTMPAAPGSNVRHDLVGIDINDPNAGGGAGSNAAFAVVQGTASASPVDPATPPSFLVLARVVRTAGDASVLAGHITQRAPRGVFPYGSGTLGSVPSTGVPGDLYIVRG